MQMIPQQDAKKGPPLLAGARSIKAAQQLREIIAGRGDLMAFVQVLQPTQSGPPHPAGIQQMGKAAFDMLASLAQELLAILTAHRTLHPRQSASIHAAQ